jgi:ParB/RepB/Spo0J family partition protein
MKLVSVDPMQIVADESLGDRYYNDSLNAESIQNLADNLEAVGLQTPLRGWLDKKGVVHIYSGFRRLRAIKLIRAKNTVAFPKIEVNCDEDEPTNMSEILLRSIATNEYQKPSPVEQATIISRLRKDKAFKSDAVLAKRLGKSTSTINNLLWLVTLKPEVQELIHLGKCSMTNALDARGNKDPNKSIIESITANRPVQREAGRSAAGRKGDGTVPSAAIDSQTKSQFMETSLDFLIAWGAKPQAETVGKFITELKRLARSAKVGAPAEYIEELHDAKSANAKAFRKVYGFILTK